MHAFFALVAGFAAMALIVIAVTALIARFAQTRAGPQSKPRPAYVFVNLGYSFLAAAAGGYVTAWPRPMAQSPMSSCLPSSCSRLAALSVLQARGQQPIAYQLALLALSPLGVVAGGLLRLRVLGVL